MCSWVAVTTVAMEKQDCTEPEHSIECCLEPLSVKPSLTYCQGTVFALALVEIAIPAVRIYFFFSSTGHAGLSPGKF